MRTESQIILHNVCKLVELAESRTDVPPPTTLPSFVAWLEEHVSEYEPYIDYEARTIKDAWGNDIVVISDNDKFVGVGSPGPNGVWEGGAGDDLMESRLPPRDNK